MNNTIESAPIVEAETVEEAVYTFRKLNASDMFLMFKILGKIGINEFSDIFGKDAVQKLMTGNTTAVNLAQSVGIAVTLDAINIILTNIPKCENEIMQMLSNTSNLTVEEVRNLDFAVFTQMVIDFVKKDEFKDFIKVVSGLFK